MKQILLSAIAALIFAAPAWSASTDKMQKKAGETASATKEWATETKEEFQSEMKQELADLKTQIGILQAEAKEATGKAKAELDRQVVRLEAQRKELSHKLDSASKTSGRAWAKMRVGLEKAMGELKTAYNRAKEEMQTKDAKDE